MAATMPISADVIVDSSTATHGVFGKEFTERYNVSLQEILHILSEARGFDCSPLSGLKADQRTVGAAQKLVSKKATKQLRSLISLSS